MTQTPTIGRIVHVEWRETTPPGQSNPLPAIIVCVHSGTMINAVVFVDGPQGTQWETSIPHEDAAEGYGGPVWRWPPRV